LSPGENVAEAAGDKNPLNLETSIRTIVVLQSFFLCQSFNFTGMLTKFKSIRVAVWMSFLVPSVFAQDTHPTYWLTNSDRSVLFQKQPDSLVFKIQSNRYPTIAIDESKKYQSMDGFGFALTGGSAGHIIKMSPPARTRLLKELFAPTAGSIGVSYVRISIGASDLNERVFSYDDLPEGETDPEMKKFDLGPDKQNVIPVLKEILAIYPAIKILGSPWSPPAWMKTIYDTRGGRLRHEFYGAYATYFVKYIRSMKDEGIKIDAITVQNEPLHPGNNPSLLMPAPDEAEFIKNYLGPAFKLAKIKTKIIVYDHNADRPDYPITIMNDPAAKK
jgi:glucosylceramidase